mgnify:CR=1 FL=1
MELSQLYFNYENIFIISYLFIISILSLFVSINVDKLYTFSKHFGIKIFKLAFLFFSVAFFSQGLIYLLNIWIIPTYFSNLSNLFILNLFINGLELLFIYTIILSGFYIIYSLIWKRIHIAPNYLVNLKIIIIHIIAISIALISLFNQKISFNLLFLSQIILFLYGIIICFDKYKNRKQTKKFTFIQLYFIALIMMLVGWIFNYLDGFIRIIYPIFPLYTKFLTICIFCIFLYGVVKTTKNF